MKLLSSFKKELTLAMRSYYFYIEIGIALVMLAVLLFAIPEHTQIVSKEYLYLDMPQTAAEYMSEEFMKDDVDGKMETVELKVGDNTYSATLIETDEQEIYLMENEAAVQALAKDQQQIGAIIGMDDQGEAEFTYYLQGYESDRLQNLLKILHNIDNETLEARFDAQEVREITSDYVPLNDRQNAVPPLMAFSGSLMGMFIMAAYVFLDKEEGVIKAFAVTASPVSRYLMSKVFVMLVTSVVTGLIVVVPIMGAQANYALLLLLLLTTGFFASVLGLLLASFYSDIMKAFGVIFVLVILFMLPAIAYFIPSWNPLWIRIIPSYPMLQGFKETILQNGDTVYVLLVSAGFTLAGIILFGITNVRFRKSFSV